MGEGVHIPPLVALFSGHLMNQGPCVCRASQPPEHLQQTAREKMSIGAIIAADSICEDVCTLQKDNSVQE